MHFSILPVALMLSSLVLAGCLGDAPGDDEPTMPPADDLPPPQPIVPFNGTGPLRFLIIGDQGTGGEGQYQVAQTMVQVCQVKGCDFVMANGDNIYEVGAITAYDPAFDLKFEAPYADLDVPFYLTLGNHDNGGSGDITILGDAQVEYHYRDDRASDKWNLPARFYSQRFGDVLEIFSLDTDTIDSEGPFVNTILPAGEVQQRWLRDAVEASDARWKISFGHYNYISNGNYGDGRASFKAAVENAVCDGVQFHVQGHDHDLQWLQPVESCGRTEIIISGAAAHTRPDEDHGFLEYFSTGDTLGFAWVEILDDTFRLQFIDVDQNVLYERTTTLADLGWE